MSRGTGTKKLLSEDTVSKALKGDKATLDELARKGGNKGSSKSDAPNEAAKTGILTPEEEAERNKILTTPVPNEESLAKELGVPVEVVRMMHSQVDKLYPDSSIAKNAAAIKAGKQGKQAEASGSKEKSEEEQPWWKKSGPGFWGIIRERGRGSTNEMPPIAGGGAEPGGGPSLEDLIKKKVVITGKPPMPTTASPSAPTAPSGSK
jgi:hypothetical protein